MLANNFDFIGGDSGQWKVVNMTPIVGDRLEEVSYIKRVSGSAVKSTEGLWALKGLISNIRYTEKEEKEKLVKIQADLGRPDAVNAAFIPIRKSEAWWALAQDERRKIFESQSHHTQIGINYLPAIARKLYHCRDIGEPFDFLTWFEYAPSDTEAFEDLLYELRKTEEWKYVDREMDIRLIRE
jgi:chlorite dismutase